MNDHNYTFEVASTNEIGDSKDRMMINVPKSSQLLSVELILIESRNGSDYILKWDVNGKEVDQIENFMIFWCRPRYTASTDRCLNSDQLNFKLLDKAKSSFIYRPDEDQTGLKFALAANSNNSTTGMQWFKCISHPPEGI